MQISALHAICISNRYMFGIGDDYNVEKTAKKIFGAKKFFHTPYSKNTNTLFKRKMSKTFTTLDSHTGTKRHDGRLLRPHADCPEPGEVKGQHALGSRQLGRLVPPMDLAGIMIAT